MRPQLIALSGYAQAGKDTAAKFLIEEGYKRIAFADALRDALYALNPRVEAWWDDAGEWSHPHLQVLIDKYGWDQAKIDVPEIRELLQRLGTEVGREQFGENFWVDMAMRKVDGPTVFTDCRFPNEAQAIKDAGGEVWRIVRPGTEPVNSHPSETALNSWDFDRVIMNTFGIKELGEHVLAVLND